MSDVIKKATRDGYGEALVELGNEIENLYVLDADLAAATKTGMFKKAHPKKFLDCGIAEQNMMGIAAGLSIEGNVVFASSFAMFAAGRAFEQVRNSIAYPDANVKIGATHAGISVGEDGATHQCCEDIALMRAIPNMVIINPADAVEAKLATKAAAAYKGPVYLRFGRLAVPVIFDENHRFEIGKGDILSEGSDVTIIATGLMVAEAVKANELLKAKGISARIVNIATIKPIDKQLILESAAKTGVIVTVEEHSIIGGLGSAVCEVICESAAPVPVLRIGVNDRFGFSGPALDLLDEFKLNAENIVNTAERAIGLKAR
ncbi:MAG: transketolase family protein [Oscillospiraceae bacterium]|jgi:transketolase|nr:transketolase family protein [Oscillospiraceae bacterium]